MSLIDHNDQGRLAFMSVVFPGIEPFLPDYFASLVGQQESSQFDIVLVNDGIADLDPYLPSWPAAIRVIDGCGHPAENRLLGFQFLVSNGYDLVVFGDADDFFAPNRVALSRQLLHHYDIVVNDVDLVDQQGQVIELRYFSHRLSDKSQIDFSYLSDKNICGLSNTAIRVSWLDDVVLEEDIIAADWALFTALLGRGARAIFTSKTTTAYRQHGANCIGLGGSPDESCISLGIGVKIQQYSFLERQGYRYAGKQKNECEQLRHCFDEDPDFRRWYVMWVKNHRQDHTLWWEEIMIPEEKPWK